MIMISLEWWLLDSGVNWERFVWYLYGDLIIGVYFNVFLINSYYIYKIFILYSDRCVVK